MVGIRCIAVRSGRQVILIARVSLLVNVCAVVGMGIDECMK